jgi:hypothetical protein
MSHYVSFIKLADRIDLCGDFSQLYSQVEQLLASSWDICLTTEHIRDAVELPRGHPLRKMIAISCANRFMSSLSFKFKKDLDELEGFSADLFTVLRPQLISYRALLIDMLKIPFPQNK